MNNFATTLELNVTTDKVFHALTRYIPLWWTDMYEGSASQSGDTFTVRFGESVHKTMQIKELIQNSSVVWNVTDSLIAIPQLKNQQEWIGTSIIWEIKPLEKSCQVILTHIGLQPNIECYDICMSGWQQFTDSLKLFVETGKGTPFKKS